MFRHQAGLFNYTFQLNLPHDFWPVKSPNQTQTQMCHTHKMCRGCGVTNIFLVLTSHFMNLISQRNQWKAVKRGIHQNDPNIIKRFQLMGTDWWHSSHRFPYFSLCKFITVLCLVSTHRWTLLWSLFWWTFISSWQQSAALVSYVITFPLCTCGRIKINSGIYIYICIRKLSASGGRLQPKECRCCY